MAAPEFTARLPALSDTAQLPPLSVTAPAPADWPFDDLDDLIPSAPGYIGGFDDDWDDDDWYGEFDDWAHITAPAVRTAGASAPVDRVEAMPHAPQRDKPLRTQLPPRYRPASRCAAADVRRAHSAARLQRFGAAAVM